MNSCIHSLLGITSWRSVNRTIRLGSYYCHSYSTFRGLGCHQYKRRDYCQGGRKLGTLTSSVQLCSTWRRTLSKPRFPIEGRYITHQTDCWIYRNSNVPTFRRSQYCVCNFLRVFWYHWYCHIQRCLQYQRCKLVQSGSTTHSLR